MRRVRNAGRGWRRGSDGSPPGIALNHGIGRIVIAEKNIYIRWRAGDGKCGADSRIILDAVGEKSAEVRLYAVDQHSIDSVRAERGCGLSHGLVGGVDNRCRA